MFRQKRSLGKNISQSNRVNKLSDIGALLYTWMIPHYDDEGRMDGDPEDIRFHVIPRRNISNEDTVRELRHMDELELISWFVVDGHPYIQMNNEAWEEHQTFKAIKRQTSKVPMYDPIKHIKYKDFIKNDDLNTLEGGPEHPKGWTPTPEGVDLNTLPDPQVKLREEKLSSFSSNEEKQPPAASFSKHFKCKVPGKYLPELLSLAKQLAEKSNGKKEFQPYRFIQQNVNNKGHPGATIKAFQALLSDWDTVDNPEGYVRAIIQKENGNYNEHDFIEAQKETAKSWKVFLKTPGGCRLVELIESAGIIKEL